jgi:hypothetical protein
MKNYNVIIYKIDYPYNIIKYRYNLKLNEPTKFSEVEIFQSKLTNNDTKVELHTEFMEWIRENSKTQDIIFYNI